MACETARRFLGPMKARDFFTTLMPAKVGQPPFVPSNLFSALKTAKGEPQMYKTFAHLLPISLPH